MIDLIRMPKELLLALIFSSRDFTLDQITVCKSISGYSLICRFWLHLSLVRGRHADIGELSFDDWIKDWWFMVSIKKVPTEMPFLIDDERRNFIGIHNF